MIRLRLLFGMPDLNPSSRFPEYFHNVCATYKGADRACQDTLKEINLTSINVPDFTKLKRRLRIVRRVLGNLGYLSEAQRSDLIKAVSLDSDFLAVWRKLETGLSRLFLYTRFQSLPDKDADEKGLEEYWKVTELHDAEFLRSLQDVVVAEPRYANSVEKLKELAMLGLRQMLEALARKVTANLISAQESELNNTAKALIKAGIERAEKEATTILRKAIATRLRGEGNQCV